MKAKRLYRQGLLPVYVLIILYITLLSRERGLSRTLVLDLFRVYREWLAGSGTAGVAILQNIALFVPLGYLVMSLVSARTSRKKALLLTVLLGFACSLLIECAQYFTGRGMADADDLFNNTLGTLLGAGLAAAADLLARQAERAEPAIRKALPLLLVIAGLLGCIRMNGMVSGDSNYPRQFWFDIDNAAYDAEELVLTGSCRVYGRETPGYRIALKQGGETRIAETVTEGDRFTARLPLSSDRGEYEIQVKFAGVGLIPADVWLTDGEVRYVPGAVSDPELPDPVYLTGAVLRAYSEQFKTWVYELDGDLIWLMDYNIDPDTEIIYHLYTDEPEKLPENRRQYGFDNRGFRLSADTYWFGDYLLFRKPIPTEYNVTAVVVGFNPGSGVTWRQSFGP